MAADTTPPSDDDAGEKAGSKPGPGFKVELDIEDAPFLKEEEEKQQARPKQPESRPDAPSTEPRAALPDKPSLLKRLVADKKRLAIVIAGLVVLLVLPLVLLMLTGGPPEPEAQAPQRIVAPTTPPREDAPEGPKFLWKAESFLVEKRGSEGELRFLHCRFAIPTDNQTLFMELNAKNVAVRDALYYYLQNKPLTFLDDKATTEMLKKDLISVVNEHISAEKIQDLYIEEYYVTGK